MCQKLYYKLKHYKAFVRRYRSTILINPACHIDETKKFNIDKLNQKNIPKKSNIQEKSNIKEMSDIKENFFNPFLL